MLMVWGWPPICLYCISVVDYTLEYIHNNQAPAFMRQPVNNPVIAGPFTMCNDCEISTLRISRNLPENPPKLSEKLPTTLLLCLSLYSLKPELMLKKDCIGR